MNTGKQADAGKIKTPGFRAGKPAPGKANIQGGHGAPYVTPAARPHRC